MKARKVTTGEGYVSGDYECWCIHLVPFDEWRNKLLRGEVMMGDSVYPSAFFPSKNINYEKKVRYKVIVEVEQIE